MHGINGDGESSDVDENSYYEFTARFHPTGPIRGKKRFLYEGGIRVPMIVRWPGRVGIDQIFPLPWDQWDLMPTLAELAETAPPPHTDGVSLVPRLMGHLHRQASREHLHWEYQ